MSLYWRADDNVRVGETKISIPSENGLEYTPGQKIQLYVDAGTKFMDGRETYLQADFKISLPSGATPTRLQLDKVGGSILIKNIRIYDGTRGNLLEEVSSYDTYVSVKYDYDKDKNLENWRALREGSAVHQPGNRGSEGTTKTSMANTLTNPYFKKTDGNQNASFKNADFVTCKMNLPIHTGIFANSETIFPLMLTQGLYIEIDLNDAPTVLKQLDSVNRSNRTKLNPFFHSLNGSTSPDDWANASASDTFYVETSNSNVNVDQFPFVVGETFNFCLDTNNSSTSNLSTGGATVSGEILEVNLSSAANGSAGLIEVKTTATLTNNGQNLSSGEYVMYSTAIDGKTSYDASYTLSNVNLIVSQVHLDPGYEQGMMNKVREGKAIEFDIMSVTNYKHSILSTDRQVTFQIFANNSRAKSLLVVPTDSSVYNSADRISGKTGYEIKGTAVSNVSSLTKDSQDVSIVSNRSGYTGISDRISSVQYTMNGRRVPSREISLKKIATKKSIDSFHLYELEKCLDNAGITPKSFSAFQDNFCFGRGFGVMNGAADLRGTDLAVILKYNESDAPTKGKLFNSYVFHLRRLMIRDGGVDIQF